MANFTKDGIRNGDVFLWNESILLIAAYNDKEAQFRFYGNDVIHMGWEYDIASSLSMKYVGNIFDKFKEVDL